jgi:hypothetical protein
MVSPPARSSSGVRLNETADLSTQFSSLPLRAEEGEISLPARRRSRVEAHLRPLPHAARACERIGGAF